MRRCSVGLGMDDWYQAPTSTARYPAVRKAGFALATCRIFFEQRGKRKRVARAATQRPRSGSVRRENRAFSMLPRVIRLRRL